MPGSGGTLGDHVDDLVSIETCALREVESLGEPLYQSGDADLIDHLGQLSGTDAAEQFAGARVTHDYRTRRVESVGVPADHDREHTVLGTGLPSRYRRVEEGDLRLSRNLARDIGRRGGVIDQNRAILATRQRTVVSVHHRTQIIVVADTHEDDVRAFRGLARGGGKAAVVIPAPLFRLGHGTVVYPRRKARLRQVTRHRVTHDAEADECDVLFAHDRSSGKCRGDSTKRAADWPYWRSAICCRRSRS